ncbi:hypothetical protein BCT35_15325 [Vibrio lentus]|uniref:DUF6864 domain-containing function n=1 Tax=Vibrio lentus TaxID=136468 RepID=UPI000C81F64C|nr:hypothetical protein [Vibrio lentus]PMJ86567.1 hypothetical protein BCU13_12165 [Vibrio lentus]PML52073.1 hypothetical protein BCT75_08950 [Vibrio lentus]PMN31301.1 hypothetical protein BCT35_15325 [Vibrio lentus]
MRIISGNQEVIESGYVDSFGMNPIEFRLSENPEMVLRLVVENNNEETNSGISGNVEDDSTLVITALNPHKTLNFGPSSALSVGTLHGRALSMIFRINVMGDYNSYNVAYTFYSEVPENE